MRRGSACSEIPRRVGLSSVLQASSAPPNAVREVLLELA